MPITYIPPSLASSPSITSDPITSIRISALPPLPPPPSKQRTNNWYITLVTETHNICLDPRRTRATNTLSLAVIQKEPRDLMDAVKTIRLASVKEDVTAGDVIECLRREGHDCYKFDGEGQGGRHWMVTALAVLRARGLLLDDGEVEGAKTAIRTMWGDDGEEIAEDERGEVVIGTFYEPGHE